MCFGIENEVVDMFSGRRLYMFLKWTVHDLNICLKAFCFSMGTFS
jgi:hypothetical protein